MCGRAETLPAAGVAAAGGCLQQQRRARASIHGGAQSIPLRSIQIQIERYDVRRAQGRERRSGERVVQAQYLLNTHSKVKQVNCDYALYTTVGPVVARLYITVLL